MYCTALYSVHVCAVTGCEVTYWVHVTPPHSCPKATTARCAGLDTWRGSRVRAVGTKESAKVYGQSGLSAVRRMFQVSKILSSKQTRTLAAPPARWSARRRDVLCCLRPAGVQDKTIAASRAVGGGEVAPRASTPQRVYSLQSATRGGGGGGEESR